LHAGEFGALAMTFWLIASVMTVIAAAAVCWPLYRPRKFLTSGSDADVYRSQLVEIDTDNAAGLIGAKEAEAARIEVSRRLLAAADGNQSKLSPFATPPNSFQRQLFAIVALFIFPLASGGLYLTLGSPGLAAESSASRVEAQYEQQSVESMVARVEAHLQNTPDDGQAWQILGPVYMRLGRYADAVHAWSNTVRILGDTSEREANLAEAMVAEAKGIVTSDAKNAFVRAVTLDPKSISGRYYLGLSAQQDGRPEEAIKIWRELIATTPEGEHWISNVRESIARLERKDTSSSPEQKTQDLVPASKQAHSEPSAMIQSMVDRLAARLKQDGSDIEGWVKLVRSYQVLNDSAKAAKAEAEARLALAGDPDKLAKLNTSLKALDTTVAKAPEAAPSLAQTATPATPSEHLGGVAAEAMVERLAERLKKSGSDPAGWLMLTRSYLTLGEKEKAAAAIEAARNALAADPAKLTQFNDALKHFNINE
jgi:cytochrome c-type biogenesis protein CcmH